MTNYTEVCLVEVTMRVVKAGETGRSTGLDHDLWETPPETEPLQSQQDQLCNDDSFRQLEWHDIYFTSDNCSFYFRTIGESTNEAWLNALDHMIDIIGVDEVFGDYLSDIKALGFSLLAQANEKRLANNPALKSSELASYINFVTAWKYESWKEPDTWMGPGEYDEEWELLGRVDLDKLQQIISNNNATTKGADHEP